MSKKPNIIIFNPDQFRADALSHMGNPGAITPNLDKIIVEDGVSFRNAFVQNPVCTPSRCSFMSGWYPHVRGHRTMFHMMKEDEPVLLRTLKENGYYVFWGGKNDLVSVQNGDFALYCDYKHRPNDVKPMFQDVEDRRGSPEGDNYYSFYGGRIEKADDELYRDSDWDNVLAAIDLIKNKPEDKPLCIYLPIVYPHPPYIVEDPFYSMIDRNKITQRIPTPENWYLKPKVLSEIYKHQNMASWSEERWTELKATYYGMCSRVDHQFGMIITALKEAGIYDDSAIFVFSDHGDFTGDYGLVEKTQNTFEDCLTRVPFIIKPPSWISVKPGIKDALVELVDFRATVEDIVNLKPNYTHFGKSLLPIIAGEKDEHRDAVFAEGGRLENESHCMETKSIHSWNPQGIYWPRSHTARSIPEHTKAVMVRNMEYKYVSRLYETDELYDLKEDPLELENRINAPEYKDIVLNLKERLIRFYMETCDVVPFEADDRV